ncbi:MAG TPA: PD-(D/E)XK nuclease family protein [Halomicronema sp.]
MRLSQRHLNFLETCPRKFQHTYLDLLGAPTSPEQQEKLGWGSRFHLLMQQRELGLPVDSLLQENPELKLCLDGLIPAAPDIFNNQMEGDFFREAEHQRTLNLGKYLMLVRYDLLIADAKNARIIDWKTYPVPQNKKQLEQDWQTRLYLYVLAETSNYAPKQISMTYWFVKTPLDKTNPPAFVKFAYSEAKHKKTEKDLNLLLDNLTLGLKRYQEMGVDFPQVDIEAKVCTHCQFAFRCERSFEKNEEETKVTNDWFDLTKIPEVKL